MRGGAAECRYQSIRQFGGALSNAGIKSCCIDSSNGGRRDVGHHQLVVGCCSKSRRNIALDGLDSASTIFEPIAENRCPGCSVDSGPDDFVPTPVI
jgi:hypothetical protein